ncbi:MAG: DMT family transporter [Chromatiales bacterium]|jgi:S-adenosylmethionine uptake transporter|nr:DMT family transporter [Chromatiales bacterium]
MLLMVVAMLMLPCIDAIAKLLGDSVPSAQVAWSRFFFQTLLMVPLVWGAARSKNLPIHAARGALLGIATALFFHGLRFLELADAISIFFVEPLLLTLLSKVVLRERVGWRRLTAVLVGFVGALIVIRPTFHSVGWPVLLPVAAAFCFAFYIILTRRAAVDEAPATMQFFSGLFGCLFMSVVLLLGMVTSQPLLMPVMPGLNVWAALALLGFIATVGHLLVVHALKRTNASSLAPFQYLELVSATLLGWWLFGDFPDLPTVLGASIIVGSGLFVFHRERVVRGEPEEA